jgi:hypothetical protein
VFEFLLQSLDSVREAVLLQSFQGLDIFDLVVPLVELFLQTADLDFVEILGVVLAGANTLQLSQQTALEFLLQFLNFLGLFDLELVLLLVELGHFPEKTGQFILVGSLFGLQFQSECLSLSGSLAGGLLDFALGVHEPFLLGPQLVAKFIGHFAQGGVFIQKACVVAQSSIQFETKLVNSCEGLREEVVTS